jgi:hypothetical protein
MDLNTSTSTIARLTTARTAIIPDIREVLLVKIVVGERRRQHDRAAIDQLKQDIERQGLLQPIGVRANGDSQDGTFTLLYGFGRFTAVLALFNEGKLPASILASIYPASMPDWRGELAEVAENLVRAELTPEERDAHTTIYAGLIKKYGDVVAVDKSANAMSRDAGGVSAHDGNGRKPTTREKVATDLNIDKTAVDKRVKRAARSVGKEVTVEKTDADTMIETGKEALKHASTSRAASPDVKITKILLKAEQQPGVTVGDVQTAIINWWCERHPGGNVTFCTSNGEEV